MPVKDIIQSHESKIKKRIEIFHDELKSLRTGRATTGLVENIKADFYGSMTPIKQMAALAVPQPDTIMIKPYDPSSLKEIEKAIKNSELSISPVIDGKMIRLSIPALSQERRVQIANQAKQAGEQAKVSVRNIRRDANKMFDKEEKDSIITEDDREDGKKNMDEITKEYTKKIDELIKSKTNEIMES
ncbi:MAG: ribosome recycling factor [Planctomycetes bacterium]|nr:ribosome recycling factor [Planctomycetota bacterium]MBL7106578.1 ribosome recycling factor [Phycisphaerae bacterium]